MGHAPTTLGSKAINILGDVRIAFIDDDTEWLNLFRQELQNIGLDINSKSLLLCSEELELFDFVDRSKIVVVVADHNMRRTGVKLLEYLIDTYSHVQILPFIYTAGFDKDQYTSLIDNYRITVIPKSDSRLTLLKKISFRVQKDLPVKQRWHHADDELLRSVVDKVREDIINDLILIQSDDQHSTIILDGVEYSIDEVILGLHNSDEIGVKYLTRYWKGVNSLNRRMRRK